MRPAWSPSLRPRTEPGKRGPPDGALGSASGLRPALKQPTSEGPRTRSPMYFDSRACRADVVAYRCRWPSVGGLLSVAVELDDLSAQRPAGMPRVRRSTQSLKGNAQTEAHRCWQGPFGSRY
jgi:hypothetical protein